MAKLLRITTVYESLQTLLPGQLAFMREQGFKVYGASAAPEPWQSINKMNGATSEQIDGCPFYALPLVRKPNLLQDIRALCRMYRLIRQLRPDIVHTHTPKAGLIGMWAAWLARTPVRIHTVAGLPLMGKRGLVRWLYEHVERLTYALATHVWPNSFGLQAYIQQHLYNGPKLRVIGGGGSNGIDAMHFQTTPDLLKQARLLREQWAIPTDAFVWIFVGRIGRDKGVDELVIAFRMIVATNPAVRLVVVGYEEANNPISQATRQAIHEMPHIVPVGYQTDVRPYMLMASALVLPSYREGLPNVLLQAACLERPVVATHIVGCSEVVRTGVTGLLVPPKDPAALTQAMLQLMRDPSLCRAMGGAARARVAAQYNRQMLWQDMLTAYQQALKTV